MALLIPVVSGFTKFGRVFFSTVDFKPCENPDAVLIEIPADCNGKIVLGMHLFSPEFQKKLRDAFSEGLPVDTAEA